MSGNAIIVGLFAALVVGGCSQPPDFDKTLLSLVDAERAFAKHSVEVGMRDAFLKFLSDDAIVFRPEPVNGLAWYQERPAGSGVLDWKPTFAYLATSGDLGFTTGPWSYRTSKEASPGSFGHYVSVWKKQKDKSWKVAIDGGIPHEPPDSDDTLILSQHRTGLTIVEEGNDEANIVRPELLSMDTVFMTAMQESGLITGLDNFVDEHIRFYRTAHFPIVGKKETMEFVAGTSNPYFQVLAWETLGGDISSSANLGYTYGTMSVTEDESGTESFYSTLRLWRRSESGRWLLLLEITNPLPPGETE